MSDLVSNLSFTAQAKADQLNADDLLSGPITITVKSVRAVAGDQPVSIDYEGDNGKPYKPCKSMRKVLIFAWGENGHAWVGKSMTLYNKRDVKFGNVEVGGIRISHMSDIASDIKISLTATRGKKEPYLIKRLDTKPAKPQPTHADRLQGMINAFAGLGVTVAMIEGRLGHNVTDTTPDELGDLTAVFKAVKSGGNVAEYFASETVNDDGVINDVEEDVF